MYDMASVRGIGDVLSGLFGGGSKDKRLLKRARSGAPHPTGARVLRGSIEAGTFENMFFVVPAKGETDRILRAARRLLDAGRQLRSEARKGERILTPNEQRITSLTAAAVRVLEEILTLSRLNRGRVFPSYDYLAEATALGRATVARSLKILENIGLLLRQRRFKRIEAKGPGPRYEQTSNAYRAFLPAFVQKYLPRWMRPAPVPVDAAHRETERQEETEYMLSRLSAKERTKATIGDSLGAVLARLGEAIERQSDDVTKRESQNHPEPLTNFNIITNSNGVGLDGQHIPFTRTQGNDKISR